MKPFRDRFDSAAAVGIPAHVTLLFPFVEASDINEDCCERLEALFSSFAPFAFELRDTRRFDKQNVLYLAPEPDEQFRALTSAIAGLFPKYPPYGGMHPDPTPHLTVAHDDRLDLIAPDFSRASSGVLPIAASAETVALIVEGQDGWWGDYRSFRLG